ncbi:MAG TPA: META domain-containing protein [Rhodanobacteraceae bacterium]|nr:META domain-containing protein [Rhodanobacteraceae bacterium]
MLALVAALVIAGSAAQALRDPVDAQDSSAAASSGATPSDLRGSDWRFVEVNGVPVPNGVDATLRLRDGRASGKAGCNAYGASWEMSANGHTKFGDAMSTKMACLEPAGTMEVERSVFGALRHAARMHRDGETLVLLDGSGKPLAKLVPDDTP